MSIRVDPDWWRTLFDEVYLLTDARTVGDADLTCREIDLICRILSPGDGARILDLCGGQGRHALELGRRGFRHCIVVDYSRPLLSKGRQAATQMGLPVHFVQADARRLSLRSARFDHVMILGNSLGYLANESDDLAILTECHRVLTSSGRLLLDVSDGRHVRANLAPIAWHEIGGDVVVCREREVRGGWVCAREMVLSKSHGLIRDKNYRIRLYDAEALTALVAQAGFSDIRQHAPPSSQAGHHRDTGCMQNRLLISAAKG
jgi:D-alanine-D-alanine ligase